MAELLVHDRVIGRDGSAHQPKHGLRLRVGTSQFYWTEGGEGIGEGGKGGTRALRSGKWARLSGVSQGS